MTTSQNKILQVRNLKIKIQHERKIYSLVEDLNFDLIKGQTLAIMGESGCGKSITAYALMGLLPSPPFLPAEGEVLFEGQNLLNLPESKLRHVRGSRLAMIFQNPSAALNPVYPVGQQLKEVVHTHLQLEDREADKLVLQALKDVRLPDPKAIFSAFPHQLSGGMLQRCMIAMALVCKPDILIADEPTTALDVTIQAQILSLLKDLQAKYGMATLLITHDMGVTAEIADQVLVMYAGEAIEEASVIALFDNPSHPYTQGLFAARPDPTLYKKRFKSKLPLLAGTVPHFTDFASGCRFHPRCQFAMPHCSTEKAPPLSLPQSDHVARCWLYDKELQWKLYNGPI